MQLHADMYAEAIDTLRFKGTWLDYKRDCGWRLHADLQHHRLGGADLACWCRQKAATCTVAEMPVKHTLATHV